MADEQKAALALRNKELQNAFALVKSQFPRLNLPGVIIEQGEGEGGAEVFPADERDNPNFGRPTVQIRNASKGQDLADLLTTELTQLAAINDPEIQTLKDLFNKDLTREQHDIAVNEFSSRVKRGVEGRNFTDFMQQVQVDSFMRNLIFPNLVTDPGVTTEQVRESNKQFFTPFQHNLAGMLQDTLRTKAPK